MAQRGPSYSKIGPKIKNVFGRCFFAIRSSDVKKEKIEN